MIAEKSLSVTASDSASSTLGKVAASGPVTVTASDSAVAVLNQLTADNEVSVHAQDSSEVTLHGEASSLDATVEDSSHLGAEDLKVPDVVLTASDSSDADVCATRSLDATLSDSSAATYTCDPDTVHKDLDESSSLTEK